MAIAAGVTPIGDDPNAIVPLLFDDQFPDWFAGVAFAAIAIGALVPAAIMSIAAANLFARNIYAEPTTGKEHFGGARYALSNFGFDTKLTVYTGILALLVNLAVVAIGTMILRATGRPAGPDVTSEDDFQVDVPTDRFKRLPATPEQEAAARR